jgi:signal peptidase I
VNGTTKKRFFTAALFLMVAAFLVRGSLVEQFLVPSGSMMPAILIGDVLLVDKASYWWRTPFKADGGIEVGAPVRGDVVVFRKPGNEGVFFVKRVAGVPGDVILVLGRRVFINGSAWETPVGAPLPWSGGGGGLDRSLGQAWRLPVRDLEGKNRELLLQGQPSARIDRSGVWIVGKEHYFMMGDNRDTSDDSREFGMVDHNLLVGKVLGTLFNQGSAAAR